MDTTAPGSADAEAKGGGVFAERLAASSLFEVAGYDALLNDRASTTAVRETMAAAG
jgi:hypothetical protein